MKMYYLPEISQIVSPLRTLISILLLMTIKQEEDEEEHCVNFN